MGAGGQAEVAWVRDLLTEFDRGTLPGLAPWQEFHRTGKVPPEMQALMDGESDMR